MGYLPLPLCLALLLALLQLLVLVVHQLLFQLLALLQQQVVALGQQSSLQLTTACLLLLGCCCCCCCCWGCLHATLLTISHLDTPTAGTGISRSSSSSSMLACMASLNTNHHHFLALHPFAVQLCIIHMSHKPLTRSWSAVAWLGGCCWCAARTAVNVSSSWLTNCSWSAAVLLASAAGKAAAAAAAGVSAGQEALTGMCTQGLLTFAYFPLHITFLGCMECAL
jgi:hypothetical protein